MCGTTYVPTDLKNPYSVVSGATPVRKSSTHFFFKLSDPRCETFLREWVGDLAQPEASNKMQEWLGAEGEASTLSDWDISRVAPYFGFEIPGAPGKYFYVWLDAPIGYYASFKNLAAKRGIDFDAWVGPHSTAEQYHFIADASGGANYFGSALTGSAPYPTKRSRMKVFTSNVAVSTTATRLASTPGWLSSQINAAWTSR